jgi:hypothetical protein
MTIAWGPSTLSYYIASREPSRSVVDECVPRGGGWLCEMYGEEPTPTRTWLYGAQTVSLIALAIISGNAGGDDEAFETALSEGLAVHTCSLSPDVKDLPIPTQDAITARAEWKYLIYCDAIICTLTEQPKDREYTSSYDLSISYRSLGGLRLHYLDQIEEASDLIECRLIPVDSHQACRFGRHQRNMEPLT